MRFKKRIEVIILLFILFFFVVLFITQLVILSLSMNKPLKSIVIVNILLSSSPIMEVTVKKMRILPIKYLMIIKYLFDLLINAEIKKKKLNEKNTATAPCKLNVRLIIKPKIEIIDKYKLVFFCNILYLNLISDNWFISKLFD